MADVFEIKFDISAKETGVDKATRNLSELDKALNLTAKGLGKFADIANMAGIKDNLIDISSVMTKLNTVTREMNKLDMGKIISNDASLNLRETVEKLGQFKETFASVYSVAKEYYAQEKAAAIDNYNTKLQLAKSELDSAKTDYEAKKSLVEQEKSDLKSLKSLLSDYQNTEANALGMIFTGTTFADKAKLISDVLDKIKDKESDVSALTAELDSLKKIADIRAQSFSDTKKQLEEEKNSTITNAQTQLNYIKEKQERTNELYKISSANLKEQAAEEKRILAEQTAEEKKAKAEQAASDKQRLQEEQELLKQRAEMNKAWSSYDTSSANKKAQEEELAYAERKKQLAQEEAEIKKQTSAQIKEYYKSEEASDKERNRVLQESVDTYEKKLVSTKKAAEVAKQEADEVERSAKADEARDKIHKLLTSQSQTRVSLAKQEADQTQKAAQSAAKQSEEQKKVEAAAKASAEEILKEIEEQKQVTSLATQFADANTKVAEAQAESTQQEIKLREQVALVKKDQEAVAEAVAKQEDETEKQKKLEEERLSQVKKISEYYKEAAEIIADAGEKQLQMWSSVANKLDDVLSDVTSLGSEYEYMVGKLNTLYETTDSNITKQSAEIIELSNKYGIAAKDLAQAGYDAIAMAADSQSMSEYLTDFENSIAKLSVAGFTDLTTVVDVLTTAMNTYGYSVEDADRLSNQLLYTQNKGKTSIKELKSALNTLISPASLIGVSFEELQAALAAITSSGIKTSQAASGLQTAFNNILKPTDNAVEVAKELGIEFDAAAIKAKGLYGVLKDIYASGATDEQLNTLFGSARAQKAIRELVSERGLGIMEDALNELTTQTTETLDNAFDIMEDTSKLRWQKIQNVLSNIKITAFDKMSESIKPLLESIQEDVEDLFDRLNRGEFDNVFNSVVTLLKQVYELAKKTVELLSKPTVSQALSKVLNIFSSIADILGNILETIDSMGLTEVISDFAEIATVLSLMSIAFTGLTGGVKVIASVSTAMSKLSGMISLANTGIGEFGRSLSNMDFSTFRTFLKEAVPNLGSIVSSLVSISTLIASIAATYAIVNTAVTEAKEKVAEYREAHSAMFDEAIDKANKLKEAYEAAAEAEERLFAMEDDEGNFTLPEYEGINRQKDVVDGVISKLSTLVDENGKLIGSTEDVEACLDSLNKKFGTNMEIVGDSIAYYKDYIKNIKVLNDDTINQAMLEAVNKVLEDGVPVELEAKVKAINVDAEEARMALEGNIEKIISDKSLKPVNEYLKEMLEGVEHYNTAQIEYAIDEVFDTLGIKLKEGETKLQAVLREIQVTAGLGKDTTSLEVLEEILECYTDWYTLSAKVAEAQSDLARSQEAANEKVRLLGILGENSAEKAKSGISSLNDKLAETKRLAAESAVVLSGLYSTNADAIIADIKKQVSARKSAIEEEESAISKSLDNQLKALQKQNDKYIKEYKRVLEDEKQEWKWNLEDEKELYDEFTDSIVESHENEYKWLTSMSKEYYDEEKNRIKDNYNTQKKAIEDARKLRKSSKDDNKLADLYVELDELYAKGSMMTKSDLDKIAELSEKINETKADKLEESLQAEEDKILEQAEKNRDNELEVLEDKYKKETDRLESARKEQEKIDDQYIKDRDRAWDKYYTEQERKFDDYQDALLEAKQEYYDNEEDALKDSLDKQKKINSDYYASLKEEIESNANSLISTLTSVKDEYGNVVTSTYEGYVELSELLDLIADQQKALFDGDEEAMKKAKAAIDQWVANWKDGVKSVEEIVDAADFVPHINVDAVKPPEYEPQMKSKMVEFDLTAKAQTQGISAQNLYTGNITNNNTTINQVTEPSPDLETKVQQDFIRAQIPGEWYY